MERHPLLFMSDAAPLAPFDQRHLPPLWVEHPLFFLLTANFRIGETVPKRASVCLSSIPPFPFPKGGRVLWHPSSSIKGRFFAPQSRFPSLRGSPLLSARSLSIKTLLCPPLGALGLSSPLKRCGSLILSMPMALLPSSHRYPFQGSPGHGSLRRILVPRV